MSSAICVLCFSNCFTSKTENGAENSENEQLVNGAGSVNGTKENSSEKTTYEGKTMAIS